MSWGLYRRFLEGFVAFFGGICTQGSLALHAPKEAGDQELPLTSLRCRAGLASRLPLGPPKVLAKFMDNEMQGSYSGLSTCSWMNNCHSVTDYIILAILRHRLYCN